MSEPFSDRLAKVLVADDEPVIAAGVRVIMDGSVELLCPVFTLKELNTAIASGPIPDLLLLDLMFGNESSLSRLKTISRRHPSVRVLVYTGYGGSEVCTEVMKAGACGFLLKPESLEVVRCAIEATLRGECWISDHIAPDPLNDASPLTQGEQSVYDLRMDGLSVKEIAENLGREHKTIEGRITRINKKLGSDAWRRLR